MFPFDLFNQEYIQILNKSLFPLLKGAVLYSIPLAVISFIFGLIIAFTIAIIRINKGKSLWISVLSILSRFYVSIIRGTPLLVQLFIIFYGLPNIGIKIDPFPAALLAFSLSVGAYASETIRAAILAISKNQWEASFSIGMTYLQTFRRIIFPQAMRIATPTLSNSFISLIKDTSLASVVLVTEMFREAQKIASVTYEFLLLYCEAAFIYWIICFLLTLIQEYLEKRLSKHLAK